jgi:hypothetical protein
VLTVLYLFYIGDHHVNYLNKNKAWVNSSSIPLEEVIRIFNYNLFISVRKILLRVAFVIDRGSHFTGKE